ncbi:hypothetical protein RJ639_046210 [Escallonia herrerae]|uniref:Reverse transcriptase RNase H-like domain-containing protein n=1 Tax=Escallonia herrerae TaxID=1293975 RepID=A0AA89B3H3_9ASTE|nr:hypothetical protein RJ639_046210 [Escallonia herrerae]
MKFPTKHRIVEVKGDQTTARQCYMTSCRSKNKEALIIEDLREDTKMQRGEPVEDLVSIEVNPEEENKTVRIGSNLKEDAKLELVNLLRTYADIFAWTAADMPRIDPEVIIHRDKDGLQKPIYYVSKVLQDVETRYPKIDKIVLALIISARRLRPYFQSHSIAVLTDQPLRKVLLSPEASGRLFDNNNFRTFCTNLSINLRFTSIAHPQSNGQTENMNRSILQGLKKKLDEAKGAWVDELPKAKNVKVEKLKAAEVKRIKSLYLQHVVHGVPLDPEAPETCPPTPCSQHIGHYQWFKIHFQHVKAKGELLQDA